MHAKRSLAQHFLVDRRVLARIVEALAPRPGEAVLEIGPGRGALTVELVRAAGRMAAVEIDPRLARVLRERFDETRLVLFEQDVLELDLEVVLEALGGGAGRRLVVAGNLPYNVSKPIVQRLIAARTRIDRAVLMFQREVAARLTATPGSRAYGPLGLLAGFAFGIEPLFDVPPRAFRPAPQVLSTVTRWLPREGPDDEELARLRTVLAASFAHRRRTLRNNLRQALGQRADACLAAAEIDGELRAEALPPPAFRRLARLWEA